MSKNQFITLIFSFISLMLFSQKKTIDHKAYKEWKRTEKVQLSHNGKFVAYERNPLIGDGYLFIYNTMDSLIDSFARGKNVLLPKNESFIALTITPGYDTLRSCEINKIEKKKWPKDSLLIYSLEDDSLTVVPKLKSVKMAEEGSVIGYTTEKVPAAVSKKKKSNFKRKDKTPKPIESNGYPLSVYTPEFTFRKPNVTEFEFEKSGVFLAFIQHEKKEDADSFHLQLMTVEEVPELIFESRNHTSIQLPVWNSTADKFAFFATKDTSENKQFDLHVFNLNNQEMWVLGDTVNYDFDTTLGVYEAGELAFIENSDYLYFQVADRVKNEKDTLTDNEKVHVDIWHYNDKYIQPQQLVQYDRDGPATKLFVGNSRDLTLFPLSNDTLDVSIETKLKGTKLIATSNMAYAVSAQWKSPALEDVYTIDITTGKTNLVKSGVSYHSGISPKGKYFSYFDPNKKQHFMLDLNSSKETCITCNLTDVVWTEEMNGQPMLAGPMETYGYNHDETIYYFQSQYDIWGYDIRANKLLSLTERKGEKRKTQFSLQKWNADSIYINLKDVYVTGFNESDKSTGIYSFYEGDDFGLYPKKVGDFKFFGIDRSRNAKVHMVRTMSVSMYPEVSILDNAFKNEKVISKTNPQQDDYNWAKVQLVKWKAHDKLPLEGLLYSPENFDPSKKYPLLVYFYELNADNLHNYNSPRPSASTINPIEYASAGYFVLIPDIRYTYPGKPAKSAYNCIVSGTEFVMRNFPIDSFKIGLQGQSWGGYQTAQLITMTKRYAAAMAGAPVSNMFSAYGGIRWGSGLNRQFQYESQQSRIGKTIWEAPELYRENSPLFHLPNVTTPLLIMHNDEDGAVPWYQGIELYNGLRRLQKPCWMLNYNEEDHNLTRVANKFDLSIRMRQFFDHYLKNEPMPIWMKKGIPAEKKGKTLGYENSEDR